MMRRTPILLAALLLVIIGVSGVLVQNAEGSGSQAATFDRIEMEVDPSIQGFGGEMTVTVTAFFYGGCCYSLFANDIIPTLEVPEGLSIKEGPTPEIKGSLTAVAGGEPTVTKFRWTLSCDKEGSYELASGVETSDCGSRGSGYTVHVIKGATITRPEMYPDIPTSDKEISLKFVSSYPVGDTKIRSANVFYLNTDEELDTSEMNLGMEPPAFDNNTWIFDTRIGIVRCNPIDLVEGGFEAQLPKVSNKYVYYQVEVTDDNDEITRSSVYRIEVEDVSAVEKWNMISFLFLLGSMILLITVLYVGQNILSKRMDGEGSEDRFSVLGPVGRKRFLTEKDDERVQIVPEMKWKYIVVGAIILISLVSAVYFIISGDAAVLFEHFLEGK